MAATRQAARASRRRSGSILAWLEGWRLLPPGGMAALGLDDRRSLASVGRPLRTIRSRVQLVV